MPYVLIWPEAQSKYNEYNSIATRLMELKTAVSNAADTTIYNQYYFLNDSFSGEYYSTYEAKVKDWCNETVRIKNEFIRMNEELQERIDNANKLKDLWQGRIGKTRWEADK